MTASVASHCKEASGATLVATVWTRERCPRVSQLTALGQSTVGAACTPVNRGRSLHPASSSGTDEMELLWESGMLVQSSGSSLGICKGARVGG